MFSQAVTLTCEDGETVALVLDQRDFIAAADAGAPPPMGASAGVDVIGFARFLRAAAAAHTIRDGRYPDVAGFEQWVVEVAPAGDDDEPDPTHPGPTITTGG